jgi:hypothetical protein
MLARITFDGSSIAALHRQQMASLALLLLSLGAAVGAPTASISGNASLVYSFYASHCPPLPAPG